MNVAIRHEFIAAVVLWVASSSVICVAQDLDIPTTPPVDKYIVYPEGPGATIPRRLQLERSYQTGVRCGPNALFILLRLFDIEASYDDVLKATPIGETGASLEDLHRVAGQFGLACQIRGDVAPDDLRGSRLPAIVHVDSAGGLTNTSAMDHFLVLTEFNNAGLFRGIDTTNLAYTTFTVEALARNMSGYALIPRSTVKSMWIYRSMQCALIALVIANVVYYACTLRTNS